MTTFQCGNCRSEIPIAAVEGYLCPRCGRDYRGAAPPPPIPTIAALSEMTKKRRGIIAYLRDECASAWNGFCAEFGWLFRWRAQRRREKLNRIFEERNRSEEVRRKSEEAASTAPPPKIIMRPARAPALSTWNQMSRIPGVMPVDNTSSIGQLYLAKRRISSVAWMIVPVPILVAICSGMAIHMASGGFLAGSICVAIFVSLLAIPVWLIVFNIAIENRRDIDGQIQVERMANMDRNTRIVMEYVLKASRTTQQSTFYDQGDHHHFVIFNHDFLADLNWDSDTLLFLNVSEIDSIKCDVRNSSVTHSGSSSASTFGVIPINHYDGWSLGVNSSSTTTQYSGVTSLYYHTILDFYTRNTSVPHWQLNLYGDELGGKRIEGVLRQGIARQ